MGIISSFPHEGLFWVLPLGVCIIPLAIIEPFQFCVIKKQ